jgi:hypothetical protein
MIKDDDRVYVLHQLADNLKTISKSFDTIDENTVDRIHYLNHKNALGNVFYLVDILMKETDTIYVKDYVGKLLGISSQEGIDGYNLRLVCVDILDKLWYERDKLERIIDQYETQEQKIKDYLGRL